MDVGCGHKICMADETAGGATEKVSMPVAPVGTATPRAALAGVSGIHVDYLDATLGRLVLDAFAQLPESPGMLNEALLSGHTNSLPDVPQVFHTIALAILWLRSAIKRRSLPLSRFRVRLAPLVPLAWSA